MRLRDGQMSDFLPPRFPLGRTSSPFFLCDCPKCGFRQAYELGDPNDVILNGQEEPDSPKTVERIPPACPKCGAEWNRTQMPDARKM